MTDDLTLPTKPQKKASRWGLFGPVLLLALLFAGWSAYWVYTANQVQARVIATQKSLIQAGYQASFDPIKVEGYPYRMFLDFHNVNIIAPSGKGFSAPAIEAEANAYALTKWVMTAPQGLTLYRGRVHQGGGEGVIDLGKVVVSGRSLKASVSDLNKPIYHVALQGTGLSLTASDTLHPFAFSKAENFEAYLRPTANVADSADMMIRLTDAYGDPQSIVGDLSPGKPLSLQVESTISHMSGFKGEDFTGSLDTWRRIGGQVTGYKAKLTAGDLSLFTTSDALVLDETSHIKGKLGIEISGTFNPIDVLGALHIISRENMTIARPLLNLTLATQGTQKFTIEFHDGSAWIGPLKVSDAPILP
ncbi:MAG: DUF2125 domain-containing protein [Asticcacaulis sp.]|uniref:DUF2125 domain-containing protein n=1 Tax=Asticcacaulis sp. TaxID=1872648 RepID=UPI0039E5B874